MKTAPIGTAEDRGNSLEHGQTPSMPTASGLAMIFAACSLFAVGACALYFWDTLEDSFITFRYAEHLAEGYGLGAWNRTGPPVEGCTTFLWMLILAGASSAGLPLAPTAKVLGCLFYLGTLLPFARLATRGPVRSGGGTLPFPEDRALRLTAVCAVLWLSTALPLAWYASTGMEATLFTCLLVWVVFGPLLYHSWVVWAVLSTLLVLTRPEGIVITALASALWGTSDLIQRRSASRCLVPILAGSLTLGLLTVLRLVAFGWPLPNTYYAKANGPWAHHVALGIKYVSAFVGANLILHGVLIVALWLIGRDLIKGGGGGRIRYVGLAVLFVFLVAWYVYVIKVGGDNPWAFRNHRHFVHVAPLFAVFVGWAFASAGRSGWKRALLLTLFASALNNVLLLNTLGRFGLGPATARAWKEFPRWESPPMAYYRYYRWFFPFKESSVTIASPLAGQLPYEIDAYHIDMLGLNDLHIAHHGTMDRKSHFVDSKSDMAYVMGLRPDLIVSDLSAKGFLARVPLKKSGGRLQMHRGMLDSRIFQREYAVVLNGPYDSWDRAIFAREDFCRKHSDWMCKPVREVLSGEL